MKHGWNTDQTESQGKILIELSLVCLVLFQQLAEPQPKIGIGDGASATNKFSHQNKTLNVCSAMVLSRESDAERNDWCCG